MPPNFFEANRAMDILAEKNQIHAIIGLGNPGAEYAPSRHNAGFWVVDALAAQQRGQWRMDHKMLGQLCQVDIEGQSCGLLKPTTFMNHSGQAVAAFMRYYRYENPQILVIHDELALLPGQLRLKRAGGHGGHNGLRDIIAHIGTEFLRLRVGIGHPGDKNLVTPYVLGATSKQVQGEIQRDFPLILQALPWLLTGQLDRAMQLLHCAPD